LRLKGAGLALAEIRQIANGDGAPLEEIRARLVGRAAEIERQLARIDAEIRSLPRLVVKRVPKLAVWSRRQAIDSYGEADALLRDLGRELPAASRFLPGAVWHDCGRRTGRIDCEAFWLCRGGVRGRAAGELEAVTVASMLHEGSDSAMLESYAAAHRWIRDNGYRIAGPNRELYPGGSVTEIQFPIQ
jgi:DNA-binding transcriptional MerR regulator